MSQKSFNRVLVTGAEGFLGRHVVERFLKARQFEVFGTYHPSKMKEGSPHSSTSVRAKEVTWIGVDLNDSTSIRSLFREFSTDIWIHCAGGFRYAMAEKITDEDLDYLINLNFKSAFFLVRELLPKMKKNNFGRMIFIGSNATLKSPVGMSAYCATKSALNILTHSIMEEVKEFDISVNTLLPSIIDTPVNRKEMSTSDFSKWVSPKELADIIFSLTSEWGNSIRGALIPVVGKV